MQPLSETALPLATEQTDPSMRDRTPAKREAIRLLECQTECANGLAEQIAAASPMDAPPKGSVRRMLETLISSALKTIKNR